MTRPCLVTRLVAVLVVFAVGSAPAVAQPRSPGTPGYSGYGWGYNPSYYYGNRLPPGYSGYYPGYYSTSTTRYPSASPDGYSGMPPPFRPLPPEALLRSLRSVPSDYPGASLRPTLAGGAVTVVVRVPADAEVWFEGVKTKQTGTERRFVSPPVLPGSYTYEIRARWKEDGREMTRSRRVAVQAGGTYRVDLTAP